MPARVRFGGVDAEKLITKRRVSVAPARASVKGKKDGLFRQFLRKSGRFPTETRSSGAKILDTATGRSRLSDLTRPPGGTATPDRTSPPARAAFALEDGHGDGRRGGAERPEPDESALDAEPRLDVTDPLVRVFSSARPAGRLDALEPQTLLLGPNEDLARLVRRFAWGGNGKRGTARVEIGAGELEGATLLIEAEGDDIDVDAELPPGVDAVDLEKRLRQRLTRRGLVLRTFQAH